MYPPSRVGALGYPRIVLGTRLLFYPPRRPYMWYPLILLCCCWRIALLSIAISDIPYPPFSCCVAVAEMAHGCTNGYPLSPFSAFVVVLLLLRWHKDVSVVLDNPLVEYVTVGNWD